ncbi:MAG: FAD-dependent oxidoreductase [Treponema sp.]|nr:FAD-dependent oxidoreductase [Treponema sp.]
MERFNLIVVGAGPAGLSAAIEAAKRGLSVIVFDENNRPGGQLFKQIHKFFGSKEHKAKISGFNIGMELLKEASDTGVLVKLNATVTGIFENKEVTVNYDNVIHHYKADSVIIATGAAENMVPFEGWTLPGVIGAGAAQTLMNIHGIKPGKRVLMLGSGNVGLVVSFQLLQAGCTVVAVVDAAPRIGGYGVHAAKVSRTGVPFYLGYTIKDVEGTDCVKGVTIGKRDEKFKIIPGTEIHFDVDTVCVAVGLSPMSQLLKMAGCKMEDNPRRGGQVPVVDDYGETSVSCLFAAGDVSGIEEASSAMIKGRMAGLRTAYKLGFTDENTMTKIESLYDSDLNSLRQGMFAPENRGKRIEKTEEGIPVSENLLTKGFIGDDEIVRFPGFTKQKGLHPVIECTQNIPCNPCQDSCKKKCIKIGSRITALPCVDAQSSCIGCGMCIANCSGQAIFLVDEDFEPGYATVTLPYEFLPLPEKGEHGKALSRSGQVLCDAEIVQIKSSPLFDKTHLLTMKVPIGFVDAARFWKRG